MAPESRIVEVDVVRGFALFGVLLENMYGFGADSPAWSAAIDRLAFEFMHVFVESKTWTLFSLLFGLGFALQAGHARNGGFPLLAIHLRRLAVLFALGAAHALLYDGDILMLYAELGLVLLLLGGLPMRSLLLLAVGLLFVFPVAHLASPPEPPDPLEFPATRAELELAQRSHVYAIGSLAEVAADNASAIPADPLEDLANPESGLAVLAMFLVGCCIGRTGVLRDMPANTAAIARVRAWGLGVGLGAMVLVRVLAATAGFDVFRPHQAGPWVQFAGDLLFAFGTPLLALGYAATLVLAARTPRGKALLAPLAGVGRMAVTIYLVQTLMFTTLFHGYGLGQAFRLGPAAVTACAVAFFAVQVVACGWWSRRFRFGPIEWLWRSATYLRWQPMRSRDESTA